MTAVGQTGQGLLPYSNKLLLNPSYAGWNKNTSIWSGLQFSALPEKRLNHAYTLTYDWWSEKMQGGLAVHYYQGLIGALNTNVSGLGFTFSKPVKTGINAHLIPAIQLNVKTASKQWFVQLIDSMVEDYTEPPSPPGKELLRYQLYQPRAGLVWHTQNIEMGVAASYSFQQKLTEYETIRDDTPYHIVFHISGNKRGRKKGLTSKPFKTTPGLILLVSENLLITRTGIKTGQTDRVSGLYIQNNFSDNIHGISGIFGWKMDHVHITFAAGTAYSIPHKKMTFFGETTIGVILPMIDFDKNHPWAAPQKKF